MSGNEWRCLVFLANHLASYKPLRRCPYDRDLLQDEQEPAAFTSPPMVMHACRLTLGDKKTPKRPLMHDACDAKYGTMPLVEFGRRARGHLYYWHAVCCARSARQFAVCMHALCLPRSRGEKASIQPPSNQLLHVSGHGAQFEKRF